MVLGTSARTLSPAHIPVEGAVTHRHLALVARGQDHVAELVGQRHEDVAPDAGLDVFQGHVDFVQLKRSLQRFPVALVDGADGDGLHRYPQVVGQFPESSMLSWKV